MARRPWCLLRTHPRAWRRCSSVRSSRCAKGARSRLFWVLFLTFFVCGLSTTGLIQTHWVSLCGDFGILPVGAASILALIGIFDLAGTVLSGWLADRYDRYDNRWLLFWYYGLRGVSLLFLPTSDFSFYALSLFAVFYGLDWVATVPPTVKLAAERFGRERAPMIFGWIFTGHQLGAATAAFGAGTTRTLFGSYTPAVLAAGFMCIGAALLLILSRRSPHARCSRAAAQPDEPRG